MVVPHEVEEPVERQVGYLEVVGPPRSPRLPPRRLQGDVDLPQEDRLGGITKLGGIGERKGENVGGPVDLEVVAVQGPQGLVAGQDERDLGVWAPQKDERLAQDRPKSGRS